MLTTLRMESHVACNCLCCFSMRLFILDAMLWSGRCRRRCHSVEPPRFFLAWLPILRQLHTDAMLTLLQMESHVAFNCLCCFSMRLFRQAAMLWSRHHRRRHHSIQDRPLRDILRHGFYEFAGICHRFMR